MNNKKFFRSGELARLSEVSTDTLRHYERLGLIPRAGRSANGYREYAPETLRRIQVIQAGLSVGFTLRELSRIFRVRERGGIPCREVRDLAVQKLQELEVRLQQMQLGRDNLKAMIRDWEKRLHVTGSNRPALLLESLAQMKKEKVK